MSRWLLGAALISGLGCGAAYADRVAPAHSPAQALAIAPAKMRAPYDVSVVTEDGETLETYAKNGRYYVLGDDGDRYIIRVTNPTANRVEAVVTVDGLDVIDGENGDGRKRGYVVPAYGELKVEGFRTSASDVATFRFSAVDDSYAGKKGKARNVGVIAVAIFEEVPPPAPTQVIVPDDGIDYDGRYDYEDDLDGDVSSSRGAGHGVRKDGVAKNSPGRTYEGQAGKEKGDASKRMAPPPAESPTTVSGTDSAGGAPSVASRPPPPPNDDRYRDYDEESVEQCCAAPKKTSRPGLGTEFGEQRYSAASYTRFVRASNRPIAVAELRYNDAGGLIALGIPVQTIPDEGEIMTRETADPFPGDGRFATPPR
jgi:hypothetical protein